MEPDLEGMRAFVVAAEELHFGRAAARLFLTQQALSKRMRRLEEALQTPLFERTTRRVQLSPAGRRFLPLAKEAVEAYDSAIAAMRETVDPLRIDVYAERFTPLRMLRQIVDNTPGLRIEPSMRQGLATALPAVLSRELDAAFGRVHDVGRPWPQELLHRPALVQPLDAFVLAGHPLAERPVIRLRDLRDWGISMPDPGGSEEWRGYLIRLCDEFGIPLRFTEFAVGVRHYGDRIRAEPRAVAVGEAGIDLPSDLELRQIPLVDPRPLHVWSIVWHRANGNPQLARLLQTLPIPAIPTDDRFWLPAVDRTALDRTGIDQTAIDRA